MREDLGEDGGVVEGEGGGEGGEGEPAGVGGVVAGGREFGALEAGAVDDGDGAAAGIAVGVAEGGELLEFRRFEAGFLEEFAAGGVDQVLVGFDEAAGDGPAERGIAAGG